MKPSEANKIDINNETDLNTLRELVKYWQNLTLKVMFELQKDKPTFKLEDIQNSNDETVS